MIEMLRLLTFTDLHPRKAVSVRMDELITLTSETENISFFDIGTEISLQGKDKTKACHLLYDKKDVVKRWNHL